MDQNKRNNSGKINVKKKVNNNGASFNKSEGSRRSHAKNSKAVKEIK